MCRVGFEDFVMNKIKRRSAEPLAEVPPDPPKKPVLLKGYLVGVRPGTEAYRIARNKYVQAWRLSGRDKWNPTYGLGWSWRKRKNADEIERLRKELREALKE
jgi:hypothetical protein